MSHFWPGLKEDAGSISIVMGIEKRKDWGSQIARNQLPKTIYKSSDEYGLAQKALEEFQKGSESAAFWLPNGNLATGLGVSPLEGLSDSSEHKNNERKSKKRKGEDHSEHTGKVNSEVRCFIIDLCVVELNGESFGFIGYLLAGECFKGDSIVAMNSTHIDQYNFGLRAHPNDGKVDITTGHLPWRQRREALKRAYSGTHLEHKNLKYRQTSQHSANFSKNLKIVVDGHNVGKAKHIEVKVLEDFINIYS